MIKCILTLFSYAKYAIANYRDEAVCDIPIQIRSIFEINLTY